MYSTEDKNVVGEMLWMMLWLGIITHDEMLEIHRKTYE